MGFGIVVKQRPAKARAAGIVGSDLSIEGYEFSELGRDVVLGLGKQHAPLCQPRNLSAQQVAELFQECCTPAFLWLLLTLKSEPSWAWGCTSGIPSLQQLKQKDCESPSLGQNGTQLNGASPLHSVVALPSPVFACPCSFLLRNGVVRGLGSQLAL